VPVTTEGKEKWGEGGGVKANGKHMERELITRVWEQSPQQGPGAKPPMKLKSL